MHNIELLAVSIHSQNVNCRIWYDTGRLVMRKNFCVKWISLQKVKLRIHCITALLSFQAVAKSFINRDNTKAKFKPMADGCSYCQKPAVVHRSLIFHHYITDIWLSKHIVVNRVCPAVGNHLKNNRRSWEIWEVCPYRILKSNVGKLRLSVIYFTTSGSY